MVACNNRIDTRPFKSKLSEVEYNINSDEEAICVTREVVGNAIKSRLLSDVPVGSFLSGGLDSSIIATVAARELSRLDTFTVSFEDVNDPYHGKADESEAAAATASLIGSKHHTVRITANDFRKNLDDFCKYGDQPFSVSSGLGIMAIAHAAKETGIKVLLSGDGADECFGGYSWYEHLCKLSFCHGELPLGATSFQNVGLPIDKRLAVLSRMAPDQRAWAWHYYAAESEKQALFSSEWQSGLNNSLSHFAHLNNNDSPETFITNDRNFYFPNEMLTKVDRMTMAYSVEGRAPFAAASVLTLAENMPLKYMVRESELKWVLRRAFEDILPMDIINRPKHGFNVPIDHWLRGDWSDMVDEAFEKGSALHRFGIVSPNSLDVARRLLSNKKRLNGHTIFSFIMLNKWLSR